jgi:serine/threonine-protein kinase
MGEVWSAEHVTLQARVAVKVLHAHALAVPAVVARFRREALLLGRMHSNHLPRAIDFLEDDVHGPVLVTELVEGVSLADLLAQPLSIEQAIELGIDLATGIAELHRASVVHRDLKPGNVILRPVGPGRTRAVIIDLGVSRLVGQDFPGEVAETTGNDVVVGTVAYMAPEQILGCGDVTPVADLYALGALLFRAVTGRHVFGADLDRLELVRAKLTRKAPSLPTARRDPVARGLAAVVARALERHPARRFQSAEELRADLLHLLDVASARAAHAGRAKVSRTPSEEPTTGTPSAFSAVRELVWSMRRRVATPR